MKLKKSLAAAGKTVKLVSENIRLKLYSPSRAMFQVQASGALTGPAAFSLGYSIRNEVAGRDHVSRVKGNRQETVTGDKATAVP